METGEAIRRNDLVPNWRLPKGGSFSVRAGENFLDSKPQTGVSKGSPLLAVAWQAKLGIVRDRPLGQVLKKGSGSCRYLKWKPISIL